MRKLSLLLTMVAMLAVACTDNGVDQGDEQQNPPEQPGNGNGDQGGEEIPDDAYISLNKDILTFAPDGESLEVKVYCNYEWTLTNNCDWVTTSVSGGEASEEGTTITLTTDLTYDDHEGTIIFSCGKAKEALVVSQSFKEAIIADDSNTFNISVEGGSVELNYQTTVECEVVIPSDAQHWISLAPETRGLVSGSATLNIAKNNTGVERSAVVKVVKVSDNTVFAEYTIIQGCYMDCVILYTTTDGNTISPKNVDYLSNTYEDGVGILEFGSTVTSIGYSAFYGCTSLTSITIPESVTKIDEYAFCDCTSLTSVTIPEGVTSIGDWAFLRCYSLQEFKGKLASSDTRCLIIDGVLKAFAPLGLTEYSIPASVTSIGASAFDGCTSLKSVAIPESVTSIGRSAFSGCTSLTSVTIPEGVTSIGDWAFLRCYSLQEFKGKLASSDTRCLIIDGVLKAFAPFGLTEYSIPASVTSIGGYAFAGCTSLASITIPDSVTSIGEWAFYGCSSLKSVYCKSTIPPTGASMMFYNNASFRKIYVPRNSVSEYKAAYGWSSYKNDIVGYDLE